MNQSFLKAALAVSVCGHLALFIFVGVSFGPRLTAHLGKPLFFLGDILSQRDLAISAVPRISSAGKKTGVFSHIRPVNFAVRQEDFFESGFRKPQGHIGVVQTKQVSVNAFLPAKPRLAGKDSVVMLYPALPYHFLLYFQDRQVVHITVAYKVNSGARSSAAVVKRKISSGNLEADLLSARYISRYLFVEHAPFADDQWHEAHIDLSAALSEAKSDDPD